MPAIDRAWREQLRPRQVVDKSFADELRMPRPSHILRKVKDTGFGRHCRCQRHSLSLARLKGAAAQPKNCRPLKIRPSKQVRR
jgi:hypothetical protein